MGTMMFYDVLNYQFWKFSESSDSSKKNHSWCNPHVFTAEIPTFEAIEPYLFITLHHSEPAPPPRTGYIMLHLQRHTETQNAAQFSKILIFEFRMPPKTMFFGTFQNTAREYSKFQCAQTQTTVLPYKMHILGLKKARHAKFSPCSVFSSIRVSQKQQREK